MMVSEYIESFTNKINDLSANYKLVCDNLKKLNGENVNKTLLMKSEEYLNNKHDRLERLKDAYNDFSRQTHQLSERFVNELNDIEEEEIYEDKGLKINIEKMMDELNQKNEILKKNLLYNADEPAFVYRNHSKSKMDVELVKKYPGSYVYKEYMYGERTNNGDIFVDCDGENDELIVKYMKNDKSLQEDLKKMNFEKKSKLLDDLNFLELPIKKKVIKLIECNEDALKMDAWRKNRIIYVNGKNAKELNELFKKYKLFNSLFNNKVLRDIHYYNKKNSYFINLQLKYSKIIEDYLKNDKKLNKDMIQKYITNDNSEDLINEMKMVGIQLTDKEEQEIKNCNDKFLSNSTILVDTQYDSYLREWLGNDHKWKLIYRASEHDYLGLSFHKYCDERWPTLIVIKSTEGWIFGGYTTKSWTYSHHNIYDSIFSNCS